MTQNQTGRGEEEKNPTYRSTRLEIYPFTLYMYILLCSLIDELKYLTQSDCLRKQTKTN